MKVRGPVGLRDSQKVPLVTMVTNPSVLWDPLGSTFNLQKNTGNSQQTSDAFRISVASCSFPYVLFACQWNESSLVELYELYGLYGLYETPKASFKPAKKQAETGEM